MEKYIGEQVEVIYQDAGNKISQRRVKVLRVADGQVRCYCYMAKAPRTFAYDGILAVMPVGVRAKRHG